MDEIERTDLPIPASPNRRRLLEIAARLGGALGAAATGILAGPFAGAGAGIALGETLLRLAAVLEPTADEVLQGPLGPREQDRVVAVLGFAIRRIGDRLNAGESVREDGFFAALEGHRPDAQQLLEGVLREAARSYNERRVRHLGSLYASFVFDREPPGNAFYLLDTAQRLTYRQMVTLAVLADRDTVLPDWEGTANLDEREPALFAEVTHLGPNRLVLRSSGQPIATIDHVNPARTVPSPLGKRLIGGLELREVPSPDKEEVTQAMWRLNEHVRQDQGRSPHRPSSDR